MDPEIPVPPTEPSSVAPKAELQLAPIEPVTLSVESAAPAADTPAAPLSLTITGDDDPKNNPGVRIDDEALKKETTDTVITAGAKPVPAPAVVTNEEAVADTELEADPDNSIPNPGDVRSSDKELGPTWFDALLLAIRSGVKLSQALADKGFVEDNKLYMKHWEANQERLKNLETKIAKAGGRVSDESATEIKKDVKTMLEGRNAQPVAASTRSRVQPPPPGASRSVPAETDAEKKAREAADTKAKPPTHAETTTVVEPVLETPTMPTTMPSLSSISTPTPSRVQPNAESSAEESLIKLTEAQKALFDLAENSGSPNPALLNKEDPDAHESAPLLPLEEVTIAKMPALRSIKPVAPTTERSRVKPDPSTPSSPRSPSPRP